MKNSILIVAVIAAATFSSCKKDYNCSCDTTTETTTVSAYPGQAVKTETKTTTSTDVVTYTKAKKADAKSNCLSSKRTNEGVQNAYTTYTSTVTETCKIK